MRTSRASTVRGWVAGLAALALLVGPTDARQFRQIQPIATPTTRQAALPDGAQPVTDMQPLSREQVEPALAQVIESWNQGGLDDQLAKGFYDRTRLLDAVDTVAPRNATLRLQSVQGVQTFAQYIEPDPAAPGRERLVSKVSVTARTQLEFVAPDGGFVRRPGINEFLLSIIYPEQAP